MWLHFMSYKLARLLLPFALIATTVFSFGLPSPWSQIAITGHAVFYSAAIIDPWIPEWFPLKYFTASLRIFIVLMIAALSATSVLFSPTNHLWQPTETFESDKAAD
jgi:hypothetical protein